MSFIGWSARSLARSKVETATTRKKTLTRRKKWYFTSNEYSISERERQPCRMESHSRMKGSRALKLIRASDGREFCTSTRMRALRIEKAQVSQLDPAVL